MSFIMQFVNVDITTTEQSIPFKLGGKTIYVRRFTGTSPANQTSSVLMGGVTNVISAEGWIKQSGENKRQLFSAIQSNDPSGNIYFDTTTGEIIFAINSADYDSQPYDLIVHYTKD